MIIRKQAIAQNTVNQNPPRYQATECHVAPMAIATITVLDFISYILDLTTYTTYMFFF